VGKKLTVLLNDDLDEKFRKAVFENKGMRRGNITESVEEALEEWIIERNKNREKK